MKQIPCKEAQDCGWSCNTGHLCDDCECRVRMKKQAKEIFSLLDKHFFNSVHKGIYIRKQITAIDYEEIKRRYL